MNKALISTILIHLFFVYGCENRKKMTTDEQSRVVHVKTASAEPITAAEPIETSGQVRAKEEINLSFKTSGIIKHIYIKEGQKVVKEQLLASLDLTEISAQVSLAHSNLEKTERDLIRVKKLYADSAATLEQVQNLTTAYNIAKENSASAQFNLNHSEIRSTCNGIVAKRWKNEGELIPAGSPMFTLFEVNNNTWIVKTGVSDKEKVRIKLKDKAMIALDAIPNQSLSGVVTHIAEMPDPMTGLYSVEISLNPTTIRLTSGYFAQVKMFPSTTKQLMTIPIEALLEGVGKKAFVYIVDNKTNTAIKKEVLLSHFDNSKAYVVSGLDDMNHVIVQGIGLVGNGSKVIIDK